MTKTTTIFQNNIGLYIGSLFLLLSLISPSLIFAATCSGSNSVCDAVDDLGNNQEDEFPNPIFLSVTSSELVDNWVSSGSNKNQGIDIFALRGALVVMPVDGVVDRLETTTLNGKGVYVYIAGDEQLFFAELDSYASGLSAGDELKKGDLIGYVGNSGSSNAATHLHFSIINDNDDFENPYDRIENEDWTVRQKVDNLEGILNDLSDSDAKDLAEKIVSKFPIFVMQAEDANIDLPDEIQTVIDRNDSNDDGTTTTDATDYGKFTVDFKFGDSGIGIVRLQDFLNKVEGENLDVNGEFDVATVNAVKRFQLKYKRQVLDIWGLTTATGNVGITTRLRMNYMHHAETATCPEFSQYNSRTTNNTSQEVRSTEILLKQLGFFTGTPDTSWNIETHNAMVSFQEAFRATMLTPWGITKGTGYKYKTTNKFMNYLRGCDTNSIYLEGRGAFDF